MTIALYPGTFDPITLGHVDLVERAVNLFDEVVIAVATSKSKKPAFSSEERIAQIKQIFSHEKKVRVIGFDGLVVDLARDQNSMVLVRGLRAVSDFEYEFQLANMNRAMLPELETIFLTPKAKYSFLSSTLVREIAEMGGDVTPFVDPLIKEALTLRFKN
jgi:pantetheine-phosphate adenylyltransferase|tara:strand:+ start:570 stop:1049 length:480 start_codon:yes stop_codon:yes gene_type:complete